jgi:hypothetical protein
MSYNAMYFGQIPTFRRNILPAHSISKSMTDNKSTESGGKPAEIITTSNPVNRTDRLLEGNIGKDAVVLCK